MPSRKDCVDGVTDQTGRNRDDVEADSEEMLNKAEGYEADGFEWAEALRKAGLDMQAEHAQRSAIARRAAILDERKHYRRHKFYRETIDYIEKWIPANAPSWMHGLANQAAHLAVEAKLVGVNLPFFKNRQSVDAQYVALRRILVGGFAHDLEKSAQGDLTKLFASQQIEKEWTAELFELWKGENGKSGLTKNAQALEIAKTIQKWQKSSMDALNREGAWIRSYSGYVTRTSHDADAIRRAGPEKWVFDTIGKLDLKRTFGTTDRQMALDALRTMWSPFANGDHFDYTRADDEPIYPNLAKRAAASRELHFLGGKEWLEYNGQYGARGPTSTVVEAFATNARRLALMKEFGTKPSEAFDNDVNYLKSWRQGEMAGLTQRLDLLRQQMEAAPNDTIKAEMERVDAAAKNASARFLDFQAWEQPLRNRFAQIDGTSMKPVNRTLANVSSAWMSVQRMSKLGRVALTHFASLPTKAGEARYWGVAFGERMGSLFRGLTSGAEGSDKRQALDLTLIAFENRLGHMMAMYDVADAPHGFLASWESTFFKLTGVSSVLDNQRGDAEAMFAAHVGSKRGQAWEEIGPKEQRVLNGFGIGPKEWRTLHQVEWSNIGGRTYLFPADVAKLPDEAVADYIRSQPRNAAVSVRPEDIVKTREDLALALATAYTDRAGFAIPMPDARTRAMMFGKNFEPGTGINTVLRLIYQFKMWPATMITRAWGREIYGTIGDGRMDRIAGLVEMMVGAAIFGTASEVLRMEIQGMDGVKHLVEHPVASLLSGLQRSGMGTLLGDFLLGQFDRHDFSAVASIAGPTFGQIDTLMDLIHAGGETNRHPWRTRAADTMKLARDNLPFMNLWMTGLALNYLVWYRLQDWINPGYLGRMEERMKKDQGTEFWLSPQKVSG
jgi:hypothetical protein